MCRPVVWRGDPAKPELRRPAGDGYHLIDDLRWGAIGWAKEWCQMNANLH
jgi:hypothetical protein